MDAPSFFPGCPSWSLQMLAQNACSVEVPDLRHHLTQFKGSNDQASQGITCQILSIILIASCTLNGWLTPRRRVCCYQCRSTSADGTCPVIFPRWDLPLLTEMDGSYALLITKQRLVDLPIFFDANWLIIVFLLAGLGSVVVVVLIIVIVILLILVGLHVIILLATVRVMPVG